MWSRWAGALAALAFVLVSLASCAESRSPEPKTAAAVALPRAIDNMDPNTWTQRLAAAEGLAFAAPKPAGPGQTVQTGKVTLPGPKALLQAQVHRRTDTRQAFMIQCQVLNGTGEPRELAENFFGACLDAGSFARDRAAINGWLTRTIAKLDISAAAQQSDGRVRLALYHPAPSTYLLRIAPI